jgi:hypothetical protein
MKTEKQRITIWLPKKEAQRLRVEAAIENKKMSQIVEEALDLYYLRKEGQDE